MKTLTIPGAQEQAMFGKARAMESLIQNKAQLDEAVAAYQELDKNFPNGMFKAIADQRIEQLQKKDTLTFYEAACPVHAQAEGGESSQPVGKSRPLAGKSARGTAGAEPPVRPGGSQPGPVGLPEPSLTPTEPVKPDAAEDRTPKTETPKTEPAKPKRRSRTLRRRKRRRRNAKGEAPKPDASKTEAPKPEAPKTEAAEAGRAEAGRAEER